MNCISPCSNVEAHAMSADKHEAVYSRIYASIPNNWGSSLLVEAIGELSHGDTIDMQIVDCYGQKDADDAELGRLVRKMLDKQRRVIAERETDEELYGRKQTNIAREEACRLYRQRLPRWHRAWRFVKNTYAGWSMP